MLCCAPATTSNDEYVQVPRYAHDNYQDDKKAEDPYEEKAEESYEKSEEPYGKGEESFQARLEEAFKLSLPFEGVDLNKHDFDKDTISLESEGITNAKKIAAILKEDLTVCVRVLGYTGKGDDLSKCVRLSLDRARAVRKILEAEGFLNKVAAKGLGFADDKGPRCELALCTAEEAEALEAEALELERQAKAAKDASEAEALELERQAKAKSKAIPPGPRTIEVQASRHCRDSYGLQFDCQDSKMPVIKTLQAGGIIDSWNSTAPLEKKVAVGMGLFAVDGKTQPNMVNILNMAGSWSMTFKVPREHTVTLRKDGTPLGLDVRKCSENGSALLVTAASCQAATAGVKPMDRIQEVNGQTGVPDELIKLMTSAEGDVTLKIHSFTEE